MRSGIIIVLCVGLASIARAQQAPSASPASKRPPTSTTPQTYSADQIERGQARFASQCGFCHGRDAAGGENGPDLTRSSVVAEDVRGNKIAPIVRSGIPDKGMPAITLSDADMMAVVAFIHDAKTKAETLSGGRRSVEPDDLRTGNVEAGKQYFNGAGGCSKCHAPTGEFAKVGSRYEGLALLQRMLYPGSGRGSGPAPGPPSVSVTTKTGEVVSGKMTYRDEFVITVTDAAGWTRSFPVNAVTISGGEDPMRAHIEQLAKYTDVEMHNVLAYLQTLR
jgi:cytochrome c oxidase cbb3-type subunit 3